MRKLKDLCLTCIGDNLNHINRVGAYLPTVHKEILLERLCCHDKMTPEYLPHVTYNLFSQNLKKLTFYKNEQINDAFLTQLHASGCQLRELTIHGCPKVTDFGVMSITQGQQELEVLELRKLLSLSNSGLNNISCNALCKLDLRGCSGITSEGLCKLFNRCPNVSHLILIGCVHLDSLTFSGIATKLSTRLVFLDVTGLHFVSNEDVSVLADHCLNLSSLILHGCNKVTSSGLSQLMQKCPTLSHLELAFCTGIEKPPESKCLTQIPETLHDLSLCGIMMNDSEFLVEALQRLCKLRVLKLCGVPAVNDDSLQRILSVIGPQLEHLDLSGGIVSPLTDEGLRAIPKYCHNIQELVLSILKQITGVTLLPLFRNEARAMNITKLLISCTEMKTEVLHEIATKCCSLEKIDVSGLKNIDDGFLISISEHCPRLTHMYLKGCRQVTDLGVCELARCLPLKCVVFSGLNKLTDQSIFALANSCPYLEEIYLSGCAYVTREAVLYLIDQCIPRVYFQHRIPNADPGQLMAKNLDTGEFCRADIF